MNSSRPLRSTGVSEASVRAIRRPYHRAARRREVFAQLVSVARPQSLTGIDESRSVGAARDRTVTPRAMTQKATPATAF